MEHIDLRDISIAYEKRGEGSPLVLLHGIPGDSRMWARQLDSFSDGHTVVAWDAPGCGRSSDPAEPCGLTDVAHHLASFVDALALGRPHVLGLSWGGGLALELYRIAPRIPRSLTLVSGYAGWRGSLPADEVARRLDAYLMAARTPPHEAMRLFAPSWFSSTPAPELVERAIELGSGYHPAALESLARSFAVTDLRPMLATIDVPTLLLYGDADSRAPLSVAQAMRSAIPRSQLVVLKDVGHVSNLEAPEEFDAAVGGFLASVE
jgi:pimeloyl-ACP methyl ester carboxylesterase